MNDAWMVRAGERQRLLEELQRLARRLEDEDDEQIDTDYRLARVSLGWLKNSNLRSRDTPTDKFFFETVLPEISKFSRAEEEKDAMVASLLEHWVKSFAGRFHSELSRKELYDPKTIFRADSATSQI